MRTDADETVADLHRLFSGLIRLASRMRLRNAMHPSVRTLTKEGETVCDEIRRGASAFFADLLSGWTPEQRRELIESMTRLSAALEEHL